MNRLLILGCLFVATLMARGADLPPPPPNNPIAMIGDSITHQGDWGNVLRRTDDTHLKPKAYLFWASLVKPELAKLGW